MKKSILFLTLAFAAVTGFAQKKTTTSASVSFDATTTLDALPKAENKAVIASLDIKKGMIAFEATIKNFSFANPKIQEHFNSGGWMDSDKFPVASFKGKITNLSAVDFSKPGTYSAEVEGDLTMHGQTNKVKSTASIVVGDKTINATSEFSVKLEDYKVEGGAIAAGKVSKEPKIMVSAEF